MEDEPRNELELESEGPVVEADVQNKLRERWKIVRDSSGLTQSDLAKILDLTQTAISRWEKGELNFREKRLLRLGEAMDIAENIEGGRILELLGAGAAGALIGGMAGVPSSEETTEDVGVIDLMKPIGGALIGMLLGSGAIMAKNRLMKKDREQFLQSIIDELDARRPNNEVQCPSCKETVPGPIAGFMFCNQCGKPFPRKCSSCGKEFIDSNAKFCGYCGNPL